MYPTGWGSVRAASFDSMPHTPTPSATTLPREAYSFTPRRGSAALKSVERITLFDIQQRKAMAEVCPSPHLPTLLPHTRTTPAPHLQVSRLPLFRSEEGRAHFERTAREVCPPSNPA